jgi:hypothetical protein
MMSMNFIATNTAKIWALRGSSGGGVSTSRNVLEVGIQGVQRVGGVIDVMGKVIVNRQA